MQWLVQILPVSKLFELLMEAAFKKAGHRLLVVPHQVRWQSADGGNEAGVRVWADDPASIARDTIFIPWSAWKSELEERLFTRIFREPAGYSAVICDFLGKRSHTVQVQDAHGTAVLYLWFGPDPDNDWKDEEGLIHVGGGTETPIAWQTYRRISNGTFDRVKSIYRDYESTPLEKRRQAIDDLRMDNERTATIWRSHLRGSAI